MTPVVSRTEWTSLTRGRLNGSGRVQNLVKRYETRGTEAGNAWAQGLRFGTLRICQVCICLHQSYTKNRCQGWGCLQKSVWSPQIPCPKSTISNRIHPSGLDGALVVQERLGREKIFMISCFRMQNFKWNLKCCILNLGMCIDRGTQKK